MTQHSDWPDGYFDRLIALSKDVPDDFRRPEPLPESPERASLDEWVAEVERDDGIRGSEPASWSE
jgi:hypothetical protein